MILFISHWRRRDCVSQKKVRRKTNHSPSLSSSLSQSSSSSSYTSRLVPLMFFSPLLCSPVFSSTSPLFVSSFTLTYISHPLLQSVLMSSSSSPRFPFQTLPHLLSFIFSFSSFLLLQLPFPPLTFSVPLSIRH